MYTAKETGNKEYTIKLVALTAVENEAVTETKAELSDNTITVTLAQEAGSTENAGAIKATKADVVTAINSLENSPVKAELAKDAIETDTVSANENISVTGGAAETTEGEDKNATASFTVEKVGDAGTYTITLKNVAQGPITVDVTVTEDDEGTTEGTIANAIKEAVTQAKDALYTAEVEEATVKLTAKENGSKTKVEVKVTKSDE